MLSQHHLELAGNFIKNGFLAVSLFFMLSGFILAFTYAGRIETRSQRRRFWEARVARLYPVYLLSLLLTAAVNHSFPNWKYAAATLLMVQDWNPFDHQMWGAWNYVCWTLSVEAFFYLLFPLCQRFFEQLNNRGRGLLTMAALTAGVLLNSGVRVLGYPTQGILASIPLPLLRFPEFLVGIGIGNLFLRLDSSARHQERPSRESRGILTHLSAIAAFVLLCRPVGTSTSLVLLPFATLVIGLAGEITLFSTALSSRILVFGGGISYALYLLQVAAKDIIIEVADKLAIGSAVVRFLALMFLLMLASTAAYSLVEVPARDRLRKFFSNLEARPEHRDDLSKTT